MNMTIGTKTIEISACNRKRDVQRGFYLDIQIPKENISFEELDALLDGCTEPIVITDDSGETTYTGFSLLNSIMAKNGIYHAEQCCVSEIEAQLSLAQKKISDQDAVIATQKQTITGLEEQNEMLTMCIMEMSEIVYA